MTQHKRDGAVTATIATGTLRAKRLPGIAGDLRPGPKPMNEGRRIAQEEMAALFDKALRDTHTSGETLAAALELGEAVVQRLRSGEVAITLRDIDAVRQRLPRLHQRIVELLCERMVATKPAGVCPGLHALTLNGEAGDVARAVRTSLQDGKWSREELLALRRELLEARAAAEAGMRDVDRLLGEVER